MTTRKAWLSGLALAIAIALSPLPEVQAAPLGPSGQPAAKSFLHVAKAKKAGKKRMKKAKKSRRAASKGGSCGTYMYRSKGKCVDARNKK